ncbi:MAG: ankyrin repeat domain-containing protein [Oligoflexia bacterium]|nr:ankyrin repeat domain-containing protein [Oligoflexia bacterium]
MNNFVCFAKYSFQWQIKSFVIVNILTLIILIFMTIIPESSPQLGLMLLYLLFLYSMSTVFSATGIAHNNTISGSSFSGKYLQSLPFSKAKLIPILVFSNIYTNIPVIISITWVTIVWNNDVSFITDEKKQFWILFISNHFLSATIICILFSLVLWLWQISMMIEFPRKAYNKGTLSNLLLMIKGIIEFLSSLAIFQATCLYSLLEKTALPVIAILLLFVFFHFWRSYRILIKEELSFWRSKRDISIIGIYILIATGFLLGLNSTPSGNWQHHFSNGPPIFSDIMDKKWDKINDYLKNNSDIGIVNQSGVALVHLLSLSDPNKIYRLNELLLQDIAPLMLKIKTKEKACMENRYCDGITSTHLLSLSDNSTTLERVINKFPVTLELKTTSDETPLHLASKSCAYTTAKVLLDKGANPNAKNSKDETPLMLAAEKNCFMIAVLLLRKDVHIGLVNKEGKSAVDIAKKNKNDELYFLLDTIRTLK